MSVQVTGSYDTQTVTAVQAYQATATLPATEPPTRSIWIRPTLDRLRARLTQVISRRRW